MPEDHEPPRAPPDLPDQRGRLGRELGRLGGGLGRLGRGLGRLGRGLGRLVVAVRSGPSPASVVGLFILAVLLLYTLFLVGRFSGIAGDDLGYPQRAMRVAGEGRPSGGPGTPVTPASTELGAGAPATCHGSQTVRVLAHILRVLVDENVWAPGDPMFKLGWFGLVSFESGPFFDDKASFQLGALRAARRLSVELVDLLGRTRGTSAPDQDLEDARGALHFDERSWRVNPFDARLPFIGAPAARVYRRARERLESYDARLVTCETRFDARLDNLLHVLEGVANDIGGLTDELAARSKGRRWSVTEKRMVEGEGSDAGIFDFRADNLFYEAHGLMWAYHGLLQGLRADFGAIVDQNDLGAVWDRMESHVAETASLEPIVVSNGREDSLLQPDHLSVMAVNMLRAWANLTELRQVLNP